MSLGNQLTVLEPLAACVNLSIRAPNPHLDDVTQVFTITYYSCRSLFVHTLTQHICLANGGAEWYISQDIAVCWVAG